MMYGLVGGFRFDLGSIPAFLWSHWPGDANDLCIITENNSVNIACKDSPYTHIKTIKVKHNNGLVSDNAVVYGKPKC